MTELVLSRLHDIRHSGIRGILATVAIAALVLLLASGLAGDLFRRPELNPNAIPARELAKLEMITQGQQADIIVQGDDAAARNKLIPVAGLVGGAVAPFRAIEPDSSAYGMAKKCLTQAVYYEAANEPLDGKRAVAQVVLNRVRHPAYPHSVCGVVYQGWNQTTCQFTFVCDGALLRAPMPRQWHEAEEVAAEALAGETEAAVGSATNYHADYVLPRWAFTLPKITQLGAHIFYRLPGRWGSAGALTASWSGREAIPQVDFDSQKLKLLAKDEATEPVVEFVPGLTVTPLESDRHAPEDVGGRIDMTKTWRPSIPLPATVRTSQPGDATAPVQGSTS
jgi:spore germination cell wall hydrolase CwlJ-like protein